jgi:uncharacterized protein YbcI
MADSAQSRGEMLAAISNGLVHLHRQYYGKGPTKAKTYAMNDLVLCMLHGGMTTVDRTLVDQGAADTVHMMRSSFQQVMEEDFTAVVEEATGRKVDAYMSQTHPNGIAVELFMMEPLEDPKGHTEHDIDHEDQPGRTPAE